MNSELTREWRKWHNIIVYETGRPPVFRASPRLPATSFFDRPACQCVKISQTSITSNVLLAIGPSVSRTKGMILTYRRPGPPDTHAMTMVNNVIEVLNYVIAARPYRSIP
jgi:hypothetical protein